MSAMLGLFDAPVVPDRLQRTRAHSAAFGDLAARPIYHLADKVCRHLQHSIAPMDQPRWSVTFRTLANQGSRA